jgi:cytochrome c oxidase assembly protein subunit 15
MKVLRRPTIRPAVSGWRARQMSPRTFQRVALVAVWALGLTILSGAAVRLTGSGLGCPDWPKCTASGVVAPLQFHAWVEFGNRLINAVVSIASLGALAAALMRTPRRRDLTLLSVGLVVGLIAEVGLGALVVKYKLAPGLVMTHFLLGLVFLGDAVLLHYRAGLPDHATLATPTPGPTPAAIPAPTPTATATATPTTKLRLVGPIQLALARLLLLATAVAVTLGTVVTSTGPHGGDPKARRFGFSLHSVAQLHGTSVEVLLAITLLTLWSLARSQAPASVIRRAEIMLLAMVAQAAVGYTQYFNGDPVGLVAVHVAGASILIVAVLRFYLGLTATTTAATTTPTTTTTPAAGAPSSDPHPATVATSPTS